MPARAEASAARAATGAWSDIVVGDMMHSITKNDVKARARGNDDNLSSYSVMLGARRAPPAAANCRWEGDVDDMCLWCRLPSLVSWAVNSARDISVALMMLGRCVWWWALARRYMMVVMSPYAAVRAEKRWCAANGVRRCIRWCRVRREKYIILMSDGGDLGAPDGDDDVKLSWVMISDICSVWCLIS